MNVMMGFMRLFSPYQLNPFDLNPLRDVVRAQFDFERLRRECPLKLFIAATTVRTGKVKLFHTAELSESALLHRSGKGDIRVTVKPRRVATRPENNMSFR